MGRANTPLPPRGGGRIAAILAVLLCLFVGLPAVATDLGPVIPKASGQCVEDPGTMRRHHFDFLKHQRDDTLRSGIRGARHSLKDCVSCHATKAADGKAVPINAEGQFCQSCHAYAAIAIDCFQCHATVPGGGIKPAAR